MSIGGFSELSESIRTANMNYFIILASIQLPETCLKHHVVCILDVKIAKAKEKFQWNFKLRGYCTSYQKLACFVLYLKIINNFFEKINYASYKKLFKELKNGIEILVGQLVFKLQIKTVQNVVFWSITHEPLGLP